MQANNISLETKIKTQHQRLLTELEENQKEIIWMLTELMEATSDETGKHIKRVAEISALLAQHHPTLSEEDVDTLFHASPMHDIGKMTVPHEILHKPGRYTEEEFIVMQSHTSNAYNLLRSSKRKLIKAAAIIAHQHHEKWNGKGYPRQLKGEEIHIYGRIVALADVFDALSHPRCYKKAWEMDEVINYIVEHSGSQFDPSQMLAILNTLRVNELRRFILLLVQSFILILISGYSLSLQAEPHELELTQTERRWIKNNPEVSVGGSQDWRPFNFITKDGQYSGIANDYMTLIAQKTGLKFDVSIEPKSESAIYRSLPLILKCSTIFLSVTTSTSTPLKI